MAYPASPSLFSPLLLFLARNRSPACPLLLFFPFFPSAWAALSPSHARGPAAPQHFLLFPSPFTDGRDSPIIFILSSASTMHCAEIAAAADLRSRLAQAHPISSIAWPWLPKNISVAGDFPPPCRGYKYRPPPPLQSTSPRAQAPVTPSSPELPSSLLSTFSTYFKASPSLSCFFAVFCSSWSEAGDIVVAHG